jgi:hypothetical protein
VQSITRWLYLSDLDHLTVREWINGLWFAVSLCVVGVFAGRLIQLGVAARGSMEEFKEFLRDVGNRGALVLFFYFLGETLIRGWVWLLLFSQNTGLHAFSLEVQDDYIIALLAAGISTWAALCIIWVFARSHWAWVFSAAFIGLFVSFETAMLFREDRAGFKVFEAYALRELPIPKAGGDMTIRYEAKQVRDCPGHVDVAIFRREPDGDVVVWRHRGPSVAIQEGWTARVRIPPLEPGFYRYQTTFRLKCDVRTYSSTAPNIFFTVE